VTCRRCGGQTCVERTLKTARCDTRKRRCFKCGDTWETAEREVPMTRECGMAPSNAHPADISSSPGAVPATSGQIDQGSSSLSLVADPDQTPARQSKANAEVFPVVGNPQEPNWSITDEEFETLRAAFPTLDIGQECKKALAWVKSNPVNRKTAKGMMRFLNGWMARNQNRGGASKPAESFAERDARLKREAEHARSKERAEAMRVQRELDEQLKKAGLG
jgi:hypothetical protein